MVVGVECGGWCSVGAGVECGGWCRVWGLV